MRDEVNIGIVAEDETLSQVVAQYLNIGYALLPMDMKKPLVEITAMIDKVRAMQLNNGIPLTGVVYYNVTNNAHADFIRAAGGNIVHIIQNGKYLEGVSIVAGDETITHNDSIEELFKKVGDIVLNKLGWKT